ncbi:uncharacterized protein EV420DRAFT_644118 [Desarmillaria tabescens]|uniref:Uncharacterized protein n=1 Tax=Armillaria tabescens TaxID=1929756 RepID=A0AA39U488_ARMTA|nr:uncharacterized protein EV420DRAFT_644118 [Desarmillaria tabescens]KAK0466725.1 hypothetical protein EV420DRAFT_644118 [Desarmillaria tabescens]
MVFKSLLLIVSFSVALASASDPPVVPGRYALIPINEENSGMVDIPLYEEVRVVHFSEQTPLAQWNIQPCDMGNNTYLSTIKSSPVSSTGPIPSPIPRPGRWLILPQGGNNPVLSSTRKFCWNVFPHGNNTWRLRSSNDSSGCKSSSICSGIFCS